MDDNQKFSRLLDFIRLSSVSLYVLLGIILGPSMLGWTSPDVSWLRIIGETGVVLLLGLAGLQIGVSVFKQSGGSGVQVALLGMVFTFTGIYFFTSLWGSPVEESLYAGIALAATSIGITTQVLHQYGLLRDAIGRTIVAAAVIDDVLVLYLLAVTHAALTSRVSVASLSQSAFMALAVVVAVYLATMWLGRQCRHRLTGSSLWRPVTAALLIYLGATSTHWAGLSIVVGGFFAGLGFGHGLGMTAAANTAKRLNPLVLISVPFFFILIGTRAEFSVMAEPAIVFFVVVALTIAVAGKVFGGMMGARSISQRRRRLLIGMGMTPRGEVALVVASIGFVQGHLSHHVFVAIVLISLTTAVIVPVMMMYLANDVAKHSLPNQP